MNIKILVSFVSFAAILMTPVALADSSLQPSNAYLLDAASAQTRPNKPGLAYTGFAIANLITVLG